MSDKTTNRAQPLPDPADLPLFTSRTPQARRLAGNHNQTSPDHTPHETPPATNTWQPQGSPTPPTPGPDTHPRAAPEQAHAKTTEQDWTLVRQLRSQVAERIQERPGSTARLDRDRDTALARSLADDEILKLAGRRTRAGQPPLTHTDQTALADDVLDSIFGLGRMESLINQDGLEDVIVRGCDNVWLYYGDGRKVRGPAVADSDEELIADLTHLAATSPTGERSFSPATPSLDLALPGGHRLAAAAWFSPRPYVTIRRHGHLDVDPQVLVELGAIDETLRQFLTAAIRAGISIVISGLPASGKTTFSRGLLNALHPSVDLATIETEFELGLDKQTDRHNVVWAGQYRQGGEGGIGEITLEQLMVMALRQTVDRIVVGEVRGSEILAMFDAMTTVQGSLSTVHATSALDTIERLVTCAIKAPHINTAFAYRQVAHHINLVVNLGVVDERERGGRRHRFVSEVHALRPGPDTATGVSNTAIFKPGPDRRAIPTGKLPDWIDALEQTGFDPAWLTRGNATWQAPIPTLANTPTRAAS